MRSIDRRNRDLARWMRALLVGTAISDPAIVPAVAADATWVGNGTPTGDFNTIGNWSPNTVPTGIATFGASPTTAVSFSIDSTVGEWKFIGPGYTFTNDHTLVFSGAGITITAGSAAITNNGNLTFANSSTPGSATITTLSGAHVVFQNFSIGGNASFITQAGGTFDISGLGANLVTGSIAGAGTYSIGSQLLTVGGNGTSTTVSGVISGANGRLAKVGTGTLTLSGVNTYTGLTDVIGGTLIVDGSIASSTPISVKPGATLGGVGAVGNTQVLGTFAPGSGVPGSSTSVAGTLIVSSGATYVIQVSPGAASSANITGTATLAGTVNAQFVAGSYVARNYTILTSTGLGGTTFDTLTTAGCPSASPRASAIRATTLCCLTWTRYSGSE